MWLLIDVRNADRPDWEGFEFLVNRGPSGQTLTSLEVCLGGWAWQRLATVPYHIEGNRMHLAIPRDLLGVTGDTAAIEFKWIDNSQAPGDILDAYTHGDTAPNGRFRCRHSANR